MNFNAYYNGEFMNFEDVKIPLTDRSVFFGDGIYDAAIGRCGKLFMIDEHLDRFFGNAHAMKLAVNTDRAGLLSIFDSLIKETNYESYFLYFQLSRFSEKRLHSYQNSDRSNLLVTLSPLSVGSPETTLKLILREDRRYKLCNIKTLNLLPAVIASKEADELGADETVFSRDGIITECAHSNVHIIKSGKLITHPLDEFILPGIARAHLLSTCARLGIPYEERYYGEDEIFSADEILVTSSSKLCARASSLEKKEFLINRSTLGARLCYAIYDDFYRKTL